jgi:hypothetical protein
MSLFKTAVRVLTSALANTKMRSALASLLLFAATSTCASVRADELPPIREDKQFLNELLRELRFSYEMHSSYPSLPTDHPFRALSPRVVGLGSLAKLGLIDGKDDELALSTFVRSSIEARIRELGVTDEIEIRSPSASLHPREIDCDLLRLMFSFQAREVELASGRAVVVVVDLMAWQDASAPQKAAQSVCLDSRYPPWTRHEATKTFVVDLGDRDGALAKSREALISLVDNPILLRIVASNQRALNALKSWIGAAN